MLFNKYLGKKESKKERKKERNKKERKKARLVMDIIPNIFKKKHAFEMFIMLNQYIKVIMIQSARLQCYFIFNRTKTIWQRLVLHLAADACMNTKI